jgi:hypothetical protein
VGLAGWICVGGRPDAGHQLVGDPSVRKRSRIAELVVEMLMELVVDHVPVDLMISVPR